MIKVAGEVRFLMFESTMVPLIPNEPKEGFDDEALEGFFFVFEGVANKKHIQ